MDPQTLTRAITGVRVLANGDRLAQVPVEIGHMNDTVAEVLTGLDAGQQVVVHPSDTLAAGKLVANRETQ